MTTFIKLSYPVLAAEKLTAKGCEIKLEAEAVLHALLVSSKYVALMCHQPRKHANPHQ